MSVKDKLRTYKPKPYGVQESFAVLLPLVEVAGEDRILYEVRSQKISQPGQTSFPGGRVEEGETPQEAAIRETVEELGIPEEKIEVCGEIDYIVTEQAVIYCFIGYLHKVDISKIKSNIEVSRVFSVSLEYFLEVEPALYEVELKSIAEDQFPYHLIDIGESFSFDQRVHQIPFYTPDDEVIWGYTANLTHRFIEIIQDN